MKRVLYAMNKAGAVLAFITSLGGLIISFLTVIKNGDNIKTACTLIFASIFAVAAMVFVIYYICYNNQFEYVKKQIEMVKNAKKSIYIVMRSLSNEKRKGREYCETLDIALAYAVMNNKDVKVITSELPDIERYVGATQIYCRGIPIGFIDGIENNDCRFIVVDGEAVAFSQDSMEEERGFSKKCQYVKSKELGRVMIGYFNDLWKSANAYFDYIPRYELEKNDKKQESENVIQNEDSVKKS